MTDAELSISDATLIARLRMLHEWKIGYLRDLHDQIDAPLHQRADLTAAKEAEAYVEELEAKLAECEARLGKAVEVAEKLRNDFSSYKFNSMGDFYDPGKDPQFTAFDATLAEINSHNKGESHDPL
jgi:hypothetical protein